MKAFEIILLTTLFTVITASNYADTSNDPCRLIPDNEFIGDPSSCNGWIRCSDGKSFPGKCPDDLRFDSKRGVCDLPENVACKDDLCTDLNEGDFIADEREPIRCAAYFYCYNGVAESYDCPDGLYFDKGRKVCDYKDKVKCTETNDVNQCANVRDGLKIRDLYECGKYWECNDGVGTLTDCEPNKLFNQQSGECEDENNVDCEIICKEKQKQKRNPKSCRSYYDCGKIGVTLKPCNAYQFVTEDATTKDLKCVDQMLVDNTECANRCDGRIKQQFVPAFGTGCTEYHPCKNGLIMGGNTIFACPTGLLFNDEKQQCVASSNIDPATCRNTST